MEFWSIAGRSLYVSGMAVLLASALGIPLGAWLGLSRSRWSPVWTAVVHTGMALPPVVAGLFLYLLFSQSGPLAAWNWLFTPQAMIAAQTILGLPFVVGITLGAIRSIPGELVMQLASLGASRWQCRWSVLREARAGVVLAVAAAFGRSISEVGAVLIVGGNIKGHTRVLTTAIILETSQGNFGLALALGGFLLGIALLVNLLIVRLQSVRPAL